MSTDKAHKARQRKRSKKSRTHPFFLVKTRCKTRNSKRIAKAAGPARTRVSASENGKGAVKSASAARKKAEIVVVYHSAKAVHSAPTIKTASENTKNAALTARPRRLGVPEGRAAVLFAVSFCFFVSETTDCEENFMCCSLSRLVRRLVSSCKIVIKNIRCDARSTRAAVAVFDHNRHGNLRIFIRSKADKQYRIASFGNL